MLKIFDGLDHYNNATDLQARQGFLDYTLGGTTSLSGWVTGVFGTGRAAQFSTTVDNTILTAALSENLSVAYVGMRLQMASGCGVVIVFMDSSGSTAKISVRFNPLNGAVEVYSGAVSGGTLLERSENNAWSPVASNYIEIGARVSTTEGALALVLNGEEIITIEDVNTAPGTNAYFNRVVLTAISVGTGAVVSYFDDFYVVGEGGDGWQGFCGNPRVCTLFAAANAVVAWTPLSGSNYEMIDEVSMDSNTSYNSSGTTNQQDTFDFGALPASISAIIGVELTAAILLSAGSTTVAQILEGDVAATKTPTGSYSYVTDLWEENPDGDIPWEPDDVDAIVAGYKVVVG